MTAHDYGYFYVRDSLDRLSSAPLNEELHRDVESIREKIIEQTKTIERLTRALEKIRSQFYECEPPAFQVWHDIIDAALNQGG